MQATSPAMGQMSMADEAVIEAESVEPPEDAVVSAGNETPGWIAALQADTPESEIHERALMRKGGVVMRDGQPVTLKYVTARYVMDRLDAAVGPANWMTSYESLPSGAVRCTITIRVPGDETYIAKTDVGVPSSIEPDKGAHSDALKRAAVQWGIARDLYDERDEDRPVEQQEQPQQQQVSPLKQQVQQGNGAAQTVVGQPEWVCPLHDDVKVVPAGISKRTGKAYTAFYACPVSGCDEKGPSIKA